MKRIKPLLCALACIVTLISIVAYNHPSNDKATANIATYLVAKYDYTGELAVPGIAAGGQIGGYVGSQVGMALGCIGGPVTGYAGYFIGRWAGRYAGML